MNIDNTNLDMEFKRYLQIMRPYLAQLVEQETIAMSTAWIDRLSNCKENEKHLRNKYVFTLCYQLARGVLQEPFDTYPGSGNLPHLNDDNNSDTSTEVDCMAKDTEGSTEVIYNNGKQLLSDISDCRIQDNDWGDYEKHTYEKCLVGANAKPLVLKRRKPLHKQHLRYYASPVTSKSYTTYDVADDDYKYRTKNLVLKLREIKTQNLMLQEELMALKEESQIHVGTNNTKSVIKVDNATSALRCDESSSTLRSLKNKLQVVQDSRNQLIQTIEHLQGELDNYEELKLQEIENIVANHKLEIFKVKSSTREEFRVLYEKKFEEQRQQYDSNIKEILDSVAMERESMGAISKKLEEQETILQVKEDIINAKNNEITQLISKINEQKITLEAVLRKQAETTKEELDIETIRVKSEQLEKRLVKMEKAKVKCIGLYENKLAHLQREKYLAECSLQLQLIRQRTQVITEIADESQTELITALDKLEAKYKEIVGNVQSTAIQRRIQDQLTLDSIIQAVVKGDSMYSNHTRDPNHSQFANRTMQNQVRDGNQSYDSEMSSLLRGNRVGNVIVGNKSYGEESVIAGYCLDGDRMGQLFERVYIPQRDTGDGPSKK